MKEKLNVNSILENVKNLSEAEQSVLAEQILKMLSSKPNADKNLCNGLVSSLTNETPDCPHCHANANMGWIIKRGHDNGKQRYFCKSCNKRFFATTNTAFARTRKDADTWKKFIKLTVSGASLQKCCEECGIAHQTAFTWRHKVLNAFLENENTVKMNGVVEVDEMLLPISYKGNHVKGGFSGRKLLPGMDNGLPRAGYERGTDNRSMSSKDKACIFCMVEDGNKSFYGGVPGVGFMSRDMLDYTVGKHVNKNTAVMLADNYKITRKYFEDNGYNHQILSSNTSENPHEHKPQIIGNLHLQHVNSMHRHLRRFLSGYCGVSSKYLESYVALYVWLKSVETTRQRNGVEKASIARTATPDCYISRKTIENRPAIPMCA